MATKRLITHADNASNSAPPVRKRTRLIEGGSAPTGKATTKTASVVAKSIEATPVMRELATSHFFANEEANKQAGIAKKARTELFAEMLKVGIKAFTAPVEVISKAGKMNLVLKAEIAAGRNTTVIDTDKLRALVDEATFLKIVKATVTDVTKFAGTEIVAQCGVTVAGAENVSVKPAK